MEELKIVNVVSTADMHQEVELIEISKLPDTIFDTEIYGGRVAYFKNAEMIGKVTIFPSGKLISVGTKSPKRAQSEINKLIEILGAEDLILPVKVEAIVRNIVALKILKNAVDLEKLALTSDGIYEPEQFPGLIIREDCPKATYLVFSSGKVVIAGCNSVDDVKAASIRIENIIKNHRKLNE